MKCTETQDYIVAYLDGEVAQEVRAEIDLHLEACAECRTEAEELRSVSALARSRPSLEPSPSWEAALDRKLAGAKWRQLTDEIAALRREVGEVRTALTGLTALPGDRKHPDPAMGDGPLMTVEEVAAYLRLPEEQVYTILDQLPYIEINYEVRFRRASIDKWLARRENGAEEGGFHWADWIDGKLPHSAHDV